MKLGKIISIILSLLIGVSCATGRTVTIQDKYYSDCKNCVSIQEFNDCADQNKMLRGYLTECIKSSQKSIEAINKCQDDSKARSRRSFGYGAATGGGITGIIVILLLILL